MWVLWTAQPETEISSSRSDLKKGAFDSPTWVRARKSKRTRGIFIFWWVIHSSQIAFGITYAICGQFKVLFPRSIGLNEELQNSYSSPNVITPTKSGRGHYIGWTCSTHKKRGEGHTEVWSEKLKGRHQSEDLRVDGSIIKMHLKGKCCGFVWIRKNTSGWHMWVWKQTFRFHKKRGISGFTE